VEADQCYLRRPGQVQVVSRDRVGLLAVGREHAGPDQGLLADHRRHADEREVFAAQQVKGVGVDRPFQQDQI
jgi:hypothetical protein